MLPDSTVPQYPGSELPTAGTDTKTSLQPLNLAVPPRPHPSCVTVVCLCMGMAGHVFVTECARQVVLLFLLK
ncbi:hypothetical protein JZ751_003889 [Albula glossodonta]|uniref:Uncharacterized protein n=1 Tax=Albula glossodonta TaxID=121402 RepID=A0A8T2P361_9TELE|nr:hypothetical protein JZ751_003889 [Albula glossodonta]